MYYDLKLWHEYIELKARWEFAHQEYVADGQIDRKQTRDALMAARSEMDIALAKLRATPEHKEMFGW